MALQAHYILLKRDRLLEALKAHPEQMMVVVRPPNGSPSGRTTPTRQ